MVSVLTDMAERISDHSAASMYSEGSLVWAKMSGYPWYDSYFDDYI